MSMKHHNRLDLHNRLIRIYSQELLDETMDIEVRNQITKKLVSTLNLKQRAENHLKTIKAR